MAVTVVQNKAGTNHSGGAWQDTFTSNVVAGNMLVALIQLQGTGANSGRTITSVVDSLGTTWTVLAGGVQSVVSTNYATFQTAIAYAPAASSGACTVTVTPSGTVNGNFTSLYELTPCLFDQVTKGTGTSTTANAGTITTTVDGCFGLLVAMSDDSFGAGNWTATGSWTRDENLAGGNAEDVTAYQAQTSAGALACTITPPRSGQWVASAMTFKPATVFIPRIVNVVST